MDLNGLWTRTVVVYDGFKDNDPKKYNLDDEELVPLLTTFADPKCEAATCIGRKCPAKTSSPSWSPVSYSEGSMRTNENVLDLNYAVFDLDHMKEGQFALVCSALDDQGYEYIIHTTHSHTAKDGCYRLIFPLTRPALPSEWASVHGTIIDVLDLPADRQCNDLARLYALPTARAGVTPVAVHRRGKPLDVDEALQIAGGAGGAVAPEPAPVAVYVEPTDLGALRKHLSDVRRRKASGNDRERAQAVILGRILDGESLAPVGERHHARVRATGILSHWLPANTPWETALELMRPCLVATDLDAGESFDESIEKTRKLYEGSMKYRLDADQKRAAETEKIKSIAHAVRDRAAPSATDLAAAAGGDDDSAWMSQLLLSKAGVRGCEHNARLLLACAPELRGTIRWNDVTKAIEVRGGPLADVPVEILDVAAAAWLQRHYDFQGGARLMSGAIIQVARENKYDPIKDYLDELAWDGESRIDTFLEVYCGAVIENEDQAKYVRAVSRRWLISLVARGLRPGCKVDTVLILEGPQGIKKSSALEALVTSAYFLDTSLELGNKDTMQAIAGSWLVELGELASLRKSDTEKVKQFISSKVDKYRPPYGATTVDSPRRCLLAGTCNPEEGDGYLKDRTGNRRFWPVRVGEPDPAGIERDRDLVLAEAVAAFRAGERWWLAGDEERLAAEETEARREESTIADAIHRWWYAEQPAKRMRQFQLLDVLQQVLQVPVDRVDHRLRTEAGQVLGRLGFECVRRREGASRVRVYVPTKRLLEAPCSTRGGLSLVPPTQGG